MEDSRQLATRAVGLLDLTRLEDDPDDVPVRRLCARALAAPVRPAAVCVYRRFVATARRALGEDSGIRVATVANFPAGNAEPRLAGLECEQAVAEGADEVDVVFPWRALRMGDEAVGADLVTACRDACGPRPLKVILESGMIDSAHHLHRAAEIAIHAGADFLKTSTGKVAVNATPEAAGIMLETIRDSGRPVGFKVSGGVRTLDDARQYLRLAEQIMGPDWISPDRFRIGASGLLDVLLAALEGQ
ncbi:MAG: deoxyribose-phosphate aldolase [Wenzhouxiangellaceae bacterium]|nr:deoxyribose-phosphate aldolase [Wenzhouxiangellaceae bacterium]MBS3745968.1 deoxyribose-phosphate aldolase [Wenzhouxiangellaceae bacterium]MBS3822330.1 deoxyribose-phosphate aldolase [Wenzhouxiangellaceae bacterium]